MKLKSFIKQYTRKILMMLFYYLRIKNEKTIFFSSFFSTQYSDSPRRISERLHELNPELKIVWCVIEGLDDKIPSYIRIVRPKTLEAIKAQAQADVWVLNGVVQKGTFKGKKTFYIQTWHGDRAFKRIGYDAYSSMGEKKYHGYARYEEPQLCDLFLVASVFGKNMMQSAFGYHGQFLEVGIPRNDVLINIENNRSMISAIKNSIGIAEDVNILLYAPTFRDNISTKQDSFVDLIETLNVLEKNGEHWICLVRAHALSLGINCDINTDSRLVDVTKYIDMADLLLISDCLITDYSSSAQDFILTKKPVFLAQFDIENYISDSRALYYDPKETGFLIANNQNQLNQLLENIKNFDHNEISEKIQKYYGINETGKSTDEVCKRIIEWCKK